MQDNRIPAQLDMLTNIVLAMVRNADRQQREAALHVIRECAFGHGDAVAWTLLDRLGKPMACPGHGD